jgi:hypothetical protein
VKRLLIGLAVVVIAAASYGVSYRLMTARACHASDGDQLAWLCREFHLNSTQATRIKALQEAYQPVCAGHCMQIMAAQSRLATLEKDGKKDSPAYAAVLGEWEALKQTCAAATLQHLQAVAAAMDPAEGRRYLALVTPRIAGHNHAQPQGLDP